MLKGLGMNFLITEDGNEYYTKRRSAYNFEVEMACSPNNTVIVGYESLDLDSLESNGYTIVEKPTIASINLPNIKQKVKILGYKITSFYFKAYSEYISIVFKTNTRITNAMFGEYITRYDIPIEAVILTGRDLEAGYSRTKTK